MVWFLLHPVLHAIVSGISIGALCYWLWRAFRKTTSLPVEVLTVNLGKGRRNKAGNMVYTDVNVLSRRKRNIILTAFSRHTWYWAGPLIVALVIWFAVSVYRIL